jgi:phytoene synthase
MHSHQNALTIAPDDRLACREWIRHHSKSFYLSSLLLPAQVRQGAWALYAFCRRADDAVDEVKDGGMRRVEGLRRRLDAVYAGRAPDDPIDRAFSLIVEQYRIPRALPEALLAGMEMDAEDKIYESDDELLLYCFRVASTVGLMMTRIMGCSDDLAYTRAADLGIAMQMTNIARDVGEDARRGRVYLPATMIDRAAVLSATAATQPIKDAVKQLLARADGHYRAADLGVPLLPRGCRFAIASSRLIYSRIGDAIAQNSYDSITQRAYVPLGKKLLLIARAIGAVFTTPAATSTGPADAAISRMLVEVGLPAPKLLS